MRKKYIFSRYRLESEGVSLVGGSNAERKIRITLTMDNDLFLEKIFGVEEFYFLPTSNNYHVGLSMKSSENSLFLLAEAKKYLNSDLYYWMNGFLQAINFLLHTDGLLEYRLTDKEIRLFNAEMDNLRNGRSTFNKEYKTNPLIAKKLTFYDDISSGKITTSYEHLKAEFDGLDSLVLMKERGLNPIERFECGLDMLIEFVNAIEDKFHYGEDKTTTWTREETRRALRSLINCVSYLSHSTSWRENAFYNFDLFELSLKSKIKLREDLLLEKNLS